MSRDSSNGWFPRGGGRRGVVAALLLAVAQVACDPASRLTQPTTPERPTASGGAPGNGFTEVAATVGLAVVHRGGPNRKYHLPDIMGSGCAWLDYNGDGHLDAYFVNSSSSKERARNRLYRNKGDGTFAEVPSASGANDAGFGMGCAVGDYDRDGDPDLYVTNFGANVLYRNDGGTFVDVTSEAGVGDLRWGASTAFVDFDEDGWLDLFLVNYMIHPPESQKTCEDSAGRQEYCGPNTHFPPARDTLYRNRGDGTFLDVTQEAGLGRTFGNGLGVAYGDFNNDGHLDMYVANDASANQLWVSDGKGRFVDRAVEWGAAYNQNGQSEAGMGVQAEDVDGDGLTDLFVTHLASETNTFYRGRPDGHFDDSTHATGLGPPSVPRTGFGVGFFDVDHDGDLDLLVTNGGVRRGNRPAPATAPTAWGRYTEQDQFFEHVAPGEETNGREPTGPYGVRFMERGVEAGVAGQPPHLGRSLALGDYDNDGDVDALVTACGADVRLYRNDFEKRGNWLIVEPVLQATGAIAYGAMVEVRAGGKSWRRLVQPAYSYLASNDPRLHFGVGEVKQVGVIVTWPDGSRSEGEHDVNQRLRIPELARPGKLPKKDSHLQQEKNETRETRSQ